MVVSCFDLQSQRIVTMRSTKQILSRSVAVHYFDGRETDRIMSIRKLADLHAWETSKTNLVARFLNGQIAIQGPMNYLEHPIQKYRELNERDTYAVMFVHDAFDNHEVHDLNGLVDGLAIMQQTANLRLLERNTLLRDNVISEFVQNADQAIFDEAIGDSKWSDFYKNGAYEAAMNINPQPARWLRKKRFFPTPDKG